METIKTNETFEKAAADSEGVVFKFEADWCPDCKRMDMFIDDIIKDYQQYKWFEVNRDELPELAQKYEVMGIPSLLVFKNGEKVAHLHSANAKTPTEVRDFLKTVE